MGLAMPPRLMPVLPFPAELNVAVLPAPGTPGFQLVALPQSTAGGPGPGLGPEGIHKRRQNQTGQDGEPGEVSRHVQLQLVVWAILCVREIRWRL